MGFTTEGEGDEGESVFLGMSLLISSYVFSPYGRHAGLVSSEAGMSAISLIDVRCLSWSSTPGVFLRNSKASSRKVITLTVGGCRSKPC